MYIYSPKKGEIATALLLFSLGAMAIGSFIGLNEIRKGTLRTASNAQTNCRYVSSAELREDNSSERLNGDSTTKFSLAYNFQPTDRQDPLTGSENFVVNSTDGRYASINKDVTLPPSYRNISVVLSLTYDKNKYDLVKPFCEGAQCSFADSQVKTIFSCGTTMKYGWYLKRKDVATIPTPSAVSNVCKVYTLTVCKNDTAPCQPVAEGTEVAVGEDHRFIGNEIGQVTLNTPPAPLMYRGFSGTIWVNNNPYTFKLDSSCKATVYTQTSTTPMPTPNYPKGSVDVKINLTHSLPQGKRLLGSICKIDANFNPLCNAGGTYIDNNVRGFGQGETPTGQYALVIFPAYFDNAGIYLNPATISNITGTGCRSIINSDPSRCIFYINQNDTTQLELNLDVTDQAISPVPTIAVSSSISAPTQVKAFCPADKEFQGIVPELMARIKWVPVPQAQGYRIVVNDLDSEGTPNENQCNPPNETNGDFCAKVATGSIGSLGLKTNNIIPDGSTFDFKPISGHVYRAYVRAINSAGQFSESSQEVKFACDDSVTPNISPSLPIRRPITKYPSAVPSGITPTVVPPGGLSCKYKATAFMEGPAGTDFERYTFISSTGGGVTHFSNKEALPNGRERVSFTGEYIINSDQFTVARVTLNGPNTTDLRVRCTPQRACPKSDDVKQNQVDVSVNCNSTGVVYGWELIPNASIRPTRPLVRPTRTAPPQIDLDGDGNITVADFIMFMRNKTKVKGMSSYATTASEILSNIGNKTQ